MENVATYGLKREIAEITNSNPYMDALRGGFKFNTPQFESLGDRRCLTSMELGSDGKIIHAPIPDRGLVVVSFSGKHFGLCRVDGDYKDEGALSFMLNEIQNNSNDVTRSILVHRGQRDLGYLTDEFMGDIGHNVDFNMDVGANFTHPPSVGIRNLPTKFGFGINEYALRLIVGENPQEYHDPSSLGKLIIRNYKTD